MKIEVADDFRVEKRDRVGGDGIAEAGVEFLGDRRAADNRPALKHGDFEPRGGEIGGRDKAIVTPADDDDVAHRYLAPVLPRKRRRRGIGPASAIGVRARNARRLGREPFRPQRGSASPPVAKPSGRDGAPSDCRSRSRRRLRPADRRYCDPLAAYPSSALNLTNTKPWLRPLHLVVRETEFCGLRLAGDFRRRMRENGRNSVSQTANRRTNRPELRGFLSTRKPRRFAGSGGDSN